MSYSRQKKKRGAAVVELAICLPVLVLVTIATIEACQMYHVQQSLKITAYEGARIGTTPQAEVTNVRFQCETLLDSQGVKGYTIDMTPDPTALEEGDFFTVTVECDFNSNSLTGGWLFGNKNITRSVALRSD